MKLRLGIGSVTSSGDRDRQREREYQRRFARRHGYFWLPCPLCGDEFGGHESWGSVATSEPDRFEGICPSCTKERQEWAERELARLGASVCFSTSRWGFPRGVVHSIPVVL